MKYAVKINNYLKGMPEIAIFNKKKEAENCFNKLNELWENDFDSEKTIQQEYEQALTNSISYIDYWEARNLKIEAQTIKLYSVKYSINNNGHVSSEVSNIKFVFEGKSVYVPA